MPEEQNNFLESVKKEENPKRNNIVEINLWPIILKIAVYIFAFYITPVLIVKFIDYQYGNQGWGGLILGFLVMLSWILATIVGIIIIFVNLYKIKNQS